MKTTHFDIFSNLFLAWFFLAIGMLFNCILWSSLGQAWIGVLMGALGIGFDLAKVRLLNNSVNSFRSANYGLGSLFGLWFITMTLLSMFAAAGFYALTVSTTQQQAAMATDAYQSAARRLETAQADIDQYAAYAHLDIDQLTNERDQALNQLLNQTALNMAGHSAGTVRSRVGDCTGNGYYQNQYCPQIQAIKEKYDTQIKQASAAHAAQARLESASADKAAANTSASVGIPIFSVVGYLLSDDGKTPQQAEQDVYIAFVIITAIVTELLSSILFIAANVFGKTIRPTFEQIRQVKLAELEIRQELEALQLPKPIANPTGGKRLAVSFDTGTTPGKDTRYQSIKSAILTGELRPSANQLRKQWQCNYETAAAYLAKMQEEGMLIRDEVSGPKYTTKNQEAARTLTTFP